MSRLLGVYLGAGWHYLDGDRGARRIDHYVLGAELWRAQLRAHAQGLPYVARAVVYAHWWPVCRAAGVLGSLSRLFVDDASISAYTTTILHFIAPFYAIFSIIENASGSIRGAGVSLQPMLLTIFGTVVLRVIWVFAIMPFDPSLEHLLLVYPVTWLITATMFTIYHHSGNWLGRATA